MSGEIADFLNFWILFLKAYKKLSGHIQWQQLHLEGIKMDQNI